MLDYGRIDISEGIDVAKNNSSKECIVCLYWFFNHGFTGFIGFLITVKGVDYRCIIYDISKPGAIHLVKNSILEDRVYI